MDKTRYLSDYTLFSKVSLAAGLIKLLLLYELTTLLANKFVILCSRTEHRNP
jgi:hypothetical protein